jgi:hypothetical protein
MELLTDPMDLFVTSISLTIGETELPTDPVDLCIILNSQTTGRTELRMSIGQIILPAFVSWLIQKKSGKTPLETIPLYINLAGRSRKWSGDASRYYLTEKYSRLVFSLASNVQVGDNWSLTSTVILLGKDS